MKLQDSISNIQIKIASNEDLMDLELCAKEFIEYIDNFKTKFLNEDFFILTAYYNQVLAGFLVAKDKSYKVNSLDRIMPSMCIYLVFINPKFRNRNIGKSLKYANTKNAVHTIIIGENERDQNAVTIRDMKSGEQQLVSLIDLYDKYNQ